MTSALNDLFKIATADAFASSSSLMILRRIERLSSPERDRERAGAIRAAWSPIRSRSLATKRAIARHTLADRRC